MNLTTYLAPHFPDLTLNPPLFYAWPIAVRFELGDPHHPLPPADPSPYFEHLHLRAKALFEAAFAPTDVCLLASAEDRYRGRGRHARRFPTIFDEARRRNLGLGRPSGCLRLTDPREPRISQHLLWAEASPRRLDYETILRRIARTDFPMGAGYSGRVYFLNLTRNLIFHMYDDRGLDLIATDRATLRPIYLTHNSWLLNYDRPRMDALLWIFCQHRLGDLPLDRGVELVEEIILGWDSSPNTPHLASETSVRSPQPLSRVDAPGNRGLQPTDISTSPGFAGVSDFGAPSL
jgi:hypothetical protein